MCQIDARQNAAKNGIITAYYIGLLYGKCRKMAWQQCLNKLTGELLGHFRPKNRTYGTEVGFERLNK